MNIQDAVKEFEFYLIGKRADATRLIYKRGLALFCQFLDTEGVKSTDATTALTARHFSRYPTYLQSIGLAKSSIGVYMSGVRNFYEWLIREDYVASPNYAETLKIQSAYRDAMRKRENKLVRFPKKGEAETMVETAEAMPYDTPTRERNYALVRFLYSSGCRNAEVAHLKVGDIDLDERSAIVTGKGSKQRRAYFDKDTLQAIKEYWRARGWAAPDEPAFARHDKKAGKRGHKPLSTRSIDNIITDVCAAAGIQRGKFTPHYFRHAFAITMLRETGNLALVQDLMGHASANSTRVYAKIYPDELRDAHHKIYD